MTSLTVTPEPPPSDDDLISEEEWNVRSQVIGLVAQSFYDTLTDMLGVDEDDAEDANQMIRSVDEQVEMLDMLDTDFLLKHALLTIRDRNFHCV
jgi:hypothetical protein